MRPGIQFKHTARPRRVVFLAFPKTVLLDLAGPWDVFNGANLFIGLAKPAYSLELVSATDDVRIETAGGPPLAAARPARAFRGRCDTVIVPAAIGADGDAIDQ